MVMFIFDLDMFIFKCFFFLLIIPTIITAIMFFRSQSENPGNGMNEILLKDVIATPLNILFLPICFLHNLNMLFNFPVNDFVHHMVSRNFLGKLFHNFGISFIPDLPQTTMNHTLNNSIDFFGIMITIIVSFFFCPILVPIERHMRRRVFVKFSHYFSLTGGSRIAYISPSLGPNMPPEERKKCVPSKFAENKYPLLI